MAQSFLGRAHEPLTTIAGAATAIATDGASAVHSLGIAGRVVVSGGGDFGLGLPDGNRSIVVPDRTVTYGGPDIPDWLDAALRAVVND